MNFRNIIIIEIILSFKSLFAQEKIGVGQHIYADKLTYITLLENKEFKYLKYYKWSPYTIAEKRNKKNKNRMCGTIGYATGAKGNGTYKVKK